MKKFLLLVVVASLYSFSNVEAGIPVRFGEVEKIVKTHDLPQTDDYTTSQNAHYDLGYLYTVYELAWMPAWTVGEGRIVGYVNGDTYVDLTPEEVTEICTLNNIAEDKSLTKMTAWDSYGGKLALLAVLALIVYGAMPSKKKKPEEESAENTPDNTQA